jgi:amino-acid N-acetyltransferase
VARERGVRRLYLLTETAERYFLARGFERINRSAVPAAIASMEEFRGACCARAAYLMLLLDGTERDS